MYIFINLKNSMTDKRIMYVHRKNCIVDKCMEQCYIKS